MYFFVPTRRQRESGPHGPSNPGYWPKGASPRTAATLEGGPKGPPKPRTQRDGPRRARGRQSGPTGAQTVLRPPALGSPPREPLRGTRPGGTAPTLAAGPRPLRAWGP